jgi:hypothetical protein
MKNEHWTDSRASLLPAQSAMPHEWSNRPPSMFIAASQAYRSVSTPRPVLEKFRAVHSILD